MNNSSLAEKNPLGRVINQRSGAAIHSGVDNEAQLETTPQELKAGTLPTISLVRTEMARSAVIACPCLRFWEAGALSVLSRESIWQRLRAADESYAILMGHDSDAAWRQHATSTDADALKVASERTPADLLDAEPTATLA